jgi:protein phosphatase
MIPVEEAHLEVAAGTDPGKKGKNNEDQFSISAYQLSDENLTPSLFAIIADGIGGHQAGEVASAIAVEIISKAVAESDGEQPIDTMESAIAEASEAIFAQASQSVEQQGMGTTCVCTWVIGDKLYVTYVGNSRLYLLRGNTLYVMTNDHTWVQEAVDAGALTKEQARVHPHANVIRRYLGSEITAKADIRIRTDKNATYSKSNQGFELKAGDRLLLCSDGLNDMVEDEVILEKLSDRDLDSAVQELIDAANKQGGKDNVTVIILEKSRKKGVAGFFARVREMKPQAAISYAGLLVMCLAVLVALVMFLLEMFL